MICKQTGRLSGRTCVPAIGRGPPSSVLFDGPYALSDACR